MQWESLARHQSRPGCRCTEVLTKFDSILVCLSAIQDEISLQHCDNDSTRKRCTSIEVKTGQNVTFLKKTFLYFTTTCMWSWNICYWSKGVMYFLSSIQMSTVQGVPSSNLNINSRTTPKSTPSTWTFWFCQWSSSQFANSFQTLHV